MKLTISLATVLCITLAGVLLLGVPAFAADEEDLKLGDTDQDWVYTAVEPCRIVDTRQNGEALSCGVSRGSIIVYGHVEAQNGGQLVYAEHLPCTPRESREQCTSTSRR